MCSSRGWVVAATLCVTATACGEPTDPVLSIVREASADAAFNPQPEPPAQVLKFEVVGPLEGRWSGRASGPTGATLQVETLSSRREGTTLHLVQMWSLYPHDPHHPPDPVTPVTATLQGVLVLGTGRLVLNGSTATGARVHVQGQATWGPAGVSVGGELMFNPQPEPPAQ